jgi:hypothetical protein
MSVSPLLPPTADVEAWEFQLEDLGMLASSEELRTHLRSAPAASPAAKQIRDILDGDAMKRSPDVPLLDRSGRPPKETPNWPSNA